MTMSDDGLPEMRGQIALQYSEEDKRFSLVVTGPQWPADNINPTAEIYYDSKTKKFKLKPGLSSTGRISDGNTVTEKDYDYDLTDLPEDLKKLVGAGPHTGPPTRIHAPGCDFLWQGDHYMTFDEYNQRRKLLDSTSARPAGYRPPPGGIDLFAIHAGSILYPPLTPGIYSKIISRCMGYRLTYLVNP
jgi:hypothetical protein